MELFGVVFSIVVFIAVVDVLAFFYYGSERKLPEEEGLVALFDEQAGGRFDDFNLSMPFVRHTVYEEFIVVAYGSTRYKLELKDIEKVSFKKGVISNGVRYHHKVNSVPSSCIVWSRAPESVVLILKERGVAVEEDS